MNSETKGLRWNKKIKTLALTASVCGLLVVVFPTQTRDTLGKVGIQAYSLAPVVLENDDIGNLYVRLNLIKNAFYFTAKSAGFGVGAGNVEYHMANSWVYDTCGVTNVHNWWLEILTNYGIFIFAGYVMFYLGLLVSLYKAYGKLTDTSEKMICETLLVGLMAFFFASMSPSSIMACRPQWIFFAFALAFLNYCNIKEIGRIK